MGSFGRLGVDFGRLGMNAGGLWVLDRVSRKPIIALSTRRLTGTSWAAGDPLATIRENGADATQAFSYTGSPPVLDHAAIQAFIGVNAAAYTIWNNQMGGNNATTSATESTQPLYVNDSSPSFNDTSYYFNIAHAANQLLTGGLSITAWLRPASLVSTGHIVNKAADAGITNGFALYSTGTSALRVRVNNTPSVDSDAVLTTDEWQFWAVTISSAGAVAYYRNNVAAGGGTANATSGITTTNGIKIGTRFDASTGFFSGRIDDLMVHPGVITAADRALLYATGAPA